MTKDEAIYILSDMRSEYNCFSHVEGGRYHALCMGIEALNEQKRGKWSHEQLYSTSGGTYAVIRCSECKAQYPIWDTKYCPNCGARMDGET